MKFIKSRWCLALAGAVMLPRSTAETATRRFGFPRGKRVTAAIAACFVALAVPTGVDIARDLRQANAVRQADSQKRLLALVGEVELGRAVQDFKDCLLRGEPSYCDGFYGHIRSVERTVALYDAQGVQEPDERKALEALTPALLAYRSALEEVRDMQGRHATIREIDNAVKGADRPAAAQLRKLAAFSNGKASEWRLPAEQIPLLLICVASACLLTYSIFKSWSRSSRRSTETAQSLRQLSNRMMAWEEDRETRASVRLHDGICQSLSGIMYFLKSAQHAMAGARYALAGQIPEPVIPSLQAVIQDARAVALQLRPPKMQDAGVLATLQSLWVDSRVRNPSLTIESRVLLDERDIPDGLKPVVLRIARMTLDFAEQTPSPCCVAWVLERDGRILRLSIDVSVENPVSPKQCPLPVPSSALALDLLEAIRARVVFSGGSSDSGEDFGGSRKIVSTWRAS